MEKRSYFLRMVGDIRFWIAFFFLLRMYGITLPPLEVGHNWRQADGLMIARNFYEHNANIFFPAVDVAGEKSGIVGCEFPILNYLICIVSWIFGYDHWYGRLIVLIFSSFGVFYFYRCIARYFGEQAGFNAAIILMVSLWFSYSRKVIPDVFSASLCIAALYYALAFFESGKWWQLLVFVFLGLLGCLSKILAATILTIVLLPLLDNKVLFNRKVIVSACGFLILAVVCIWYFWWVPYLNTTFGLEGHFFMGFSFQEGAARLFFHPGVLKRFYDTPLKYSGFAVFLISLFLVVKNKNWLALNAFLLAFGSFMVLLIKTGAHIVQDHYYILTVIPAMALICGVGLTYVKQHKIVAGLLIIISIEGIANQENDFRLREPFRSVQNLETVMDEVSGPNDLIAINSGYHNPTAMYFAHRKGWVVPNEQLMENDFVTDIKDKGCRYIVVVKELYGDLSLEYPVVHNSANFKVYELQ